MPGKSRLALCMLGCLGVLAGRSNAQGLEPVSPDMLGKSGVACIKMDDAGKITGAFLLTTSGDPKVDDEMLQWVRHLHWDPVTPGDHSRNIWFPIGLGFGVKPQVAPSRCSPALGSPTDT